MAWIGAAIKLIGVVKGSKDLTKLISIGEKLVARYEKKIKRNLSKEEKSEFYKSLGESDEAFNDYFNSPPSDND